ncbi:phage minor head protein [Methanobrevibacter sp.]|uniref:phage minor head protein n=1 Tax=Methanobrevibacter sp. TaxID=66852 RepID=UPI00388D34F1
MVSEERIKTNLLLMDELDYWDELTVKAINDEWTLRYYNHIMNLLNNQVDESIKWLDSEEAKELFYGEAEYQHELFRALEDQWDEILENKYPSIEALLQEVYNRGKAKGYTEMREHIRFTDTDKLALEFVTNYNFALIRRLDDDTREQIKNNITSAVLSGENPRSIAPKIMDTIGTRLEGSTFTPMQRAVMIARTEISRTQNTGILQSYVNEGYTEVKILTAEDSNVCYTCLSYAYEFNEETPVIFENHGKEKVHNIKELIKGEMFPPFHPNCRCTYLSIWKSKEEPPIDAEVVDLTVGNQMNLDSFIHKQDKFKDYSQSKKIAKELALSYERVNGNEIFKDYKNGVELKFNREFLEKLDEMNSNNEIYYSKYDILKMYKDSPKLFKQVSNKILFSTYNMSGEENATGYYNDRTETITILPLAFTIPHFEPTNLNLTLYHEMSHALDHKKSKNNGKYGLSIEDDTYSLFVANDKKYQEQKYGQEYFVSNHAKDKGIHEDFPESMAITALILDGKNESAILRLSNGEKCSLKCWKERFPNRYEYCKNILENHTLKNFIKYYVDLEVKKCQLLGKF